MEDWLLIVIVILVVYFFTSGLHKKVTTKACEMHMRMVAPTPEKQVAPAAPVDKKEQLASALMDDCITSTDEQSCDVGAVVPTPYADSDYGNAGSQFSDWTVQSLDPKIIESNKQFVKDRLGNPGSWTGATFSPDRHDTYDAVPWQGLSRPTAVAVNAPDQIPDIDLDRNPERKRFTWDSAPPTSS